MGQLNERKAADTVLISVEQSSMSWVWGYDYGDEDRPRPSNRRSNAPSPELCPKAISATSLAVAKHTSSISSLTDVKTHQSNPVSTDLSRKDPETVNTTVMTLTHRPKNSNTNVMTLTHRPKQSPV
ncbi:hypothetical protein PG989_003662 [Apiospora arundinis]